MTHRKNLYRRLVLAVSFGAVSIGSAVPARASYGIARLTSSGALDNTFSGDGKNTDLASTELWAADTLPFSGGKMLVGGHFTAPDGRSSGIIGKLNADGSADTNFGWLGVAPAEYSPTTSEVVYVIDWQSDLKIIAAGAVFGPGGTRFAVWRYNTNGTPDTTFGVNGVATAFLGPGDLFDMRVSSDKIIVTGSMNGLVAVARFNANGTLDTSFSGDGMVTADFGSGFSEAGHGVAIAAGKILIAGNVSGNATTSMGVMRFTSAGVLDTTFDGDGKVFIDFPGTTNEIPFDIACWPSQGCFVAGSTNPSSATQSFAIVRLQDNGAIEPGFGKRTLNFPGATSASATSVRITNDLRLVVGGDAIVGGVGQLAVAKYEFNGLLDTTFSGDGLQLVSFPGFDLASTYTSIDPATGKIIPVGRH
jgi:uncharacterized delta-60 repeat protein